MSEGFPKNTTSKEQVPGTPEKSTNETAKKIELFASVKEPEALHKTTPEQTSEMGKYEEMIAEMDAGFDFFKVKYDLDAFSAIGRISYDNLIANTSRTAANKHVSIFIKPLRTLEDASASGLIPSSVVAEILAKYKVIANAIGYYNADGTLHHDR